METIRNLVDEIRGGAEADDLHKKLEETFSEFYNSKKDTQLSMSLEEKFVLRELKLSPELLEQEQRAKTECQPKIVPLKMVGSSGNSRKNVVH